MNLELRVIVVLLIFPFFTLQAMADSFPVRKAGLWEIKVGMEGLPETVMKQCTDESTDNEMMQGIGNTPGASCEKPMIKKKGNTVTSVISCRMQNTKLTSESVLKGDFETHYEGTTITRFNPPIAGQAETKSTMSAKWLGACAEGQVPGDMIMPTGQKINIKSAYMK